MIEDDKYIYYIDGKIWSKYKQDYLKPYLANHGYYMVSVYGKLKLLHRVIASVFLPNPSGFMYINHINGIKTDCHVANLEWCTASHNQKHAYNNSLRIPSQTGKSGNRHHRSRKIYSIQETSIIEHESINLCAKYFKASRGNIYKALKKGYSYKGHKLYV